MTANTTKHRKRK